MSRLTKLACAALMALALAGGMSTAAMAAPPRGCDAVPRLCDDPPPDDLAFAGDPSQWGIESAYKRGSFDITDVEELLAAGGTTKGGDVPVTTG